MKIKLSDYVSSFFVEKGIKHVFTVTGGGAMHLNDSFGHQKGLKCIYNHHEQACAIAAEAYSRINNTPAILCVTTGPGGTNALTGVVGAYLDSLPMIVISGQVRYDTTARYTEQFTDGLKLRAVGDQEFDITKSVQNMCKYAVMLENPNDIKYCLEKAYKLSTTGRMGPCWIDIPVNFQGTYIETDNLKGYNEKIENPHIKEEDLKIIVKKLKEAKRPIIYAGNGIRLSGGYKDFKQLLKKLRIPVVTCWDSIDLIEDENPLYTGRGGIMGDRAGNFAVQNSDFVLAIGNRLSIRQVGYNWKTWAREAYVAMVDIDPAELKKHTLHVDLPIHADAKDFINRLNCKINKPITKDEWVSVCKNWKRKYPVTLEKHWKEDGQHANVYAFIKYLSSKLKEKSLTVVSNGSACVVGSHNYEIQKDSRFIINSSIACMGYGLPASIGACVAAGKETICIEGDGSIMMNLQELQTIITNKLPIKIFLINNQGYHSIRQTQNNLFREHSKVGIGEESKDLSFPNYKKIANAFGYKYYSAKTNEQMKRVVTKALKEDNPVMCEIFVSTEQNFEPKSSTKKLSDGTLVSPPLEDLAPFLDRQELLDNLYIEPINE